MIVKEFVGIGNENVSGSCLDHCKNTLESFDCKNVEDSKYLQSVVGAKDCMDYSYWGRDSELIYETHATGYNCRNILFCNECWENNTDLMYCDSCINSSHLFGCIGLRRKEYCIFNKQYTKDQYEQLVSKIIEHMRSTKEWGEFFPLSICHFGYNETVAQDYFPLAKEELLTRGWKWQEEEKPEENYLGPNTAIPDDIHDVTDEITKQILRCEITGKPYKIIPQELLFYRNMGLPLPKKSPDQRHKERIARRNPRKLWNRNCQKCNKAIRTSFASDRPEIVYCEDCYLSSVY